MNLAGAVMLDLADTVVRLTAATMIGGAIGLDRDLRGKPTGVRTMGIVSLGAALIVLASQYNGPSPDTAAASRVMQGIITGIGFLGAGVIIRNPSGKRVRGLTTAAAIWLTATIGAACGAGAWPLVVPAAILVFLLFTLGRHIELTVERYFKDPAQDNPDGDTNP